MEDTFKKIRPTSIRIVTTADVYEEDQKYENGMIDLNKRKGNYKLIQTVLAVGPLVKYCTVGEKIKINVTHFLKKEVVRRMMNSIEQMKKEEIKVKYDDWEIPTINAFGQTCFMINQDDIDFIIEEE